MKLTQKQIDKIKHGSEVGLGISFVLLVVLGLIPEIWGIHIPKFVMSIVLTCFFLSFAVLVASSFWASDEEKEEFKRAVKDAVQEAREEEIQKKRRIPQSQEEVKCPLVEVNDRQKEEIIDLLKRRITPHEKDTNRFNRSVVYAYLTALRAAHIMTPVSTDEDKDERRRWIEQITGLYEPQNEWAHFRGDYDEFKKTKKARDAKKEIDKIIEKFR